VGSPDNPDSPETEWGELVTDEEYLVGRGD
jgi:hypothetical protein